MIKNGKVPLVGKGNNLRSMSNTENLAYAFILAITNPNVVGKILGTETNTFSGKICCSSNRFTQKLHVKTKLQFNRFVSQDIKTN